MPNITLSQGAFDELRAIFVANPQAQPAPAPAVPGAVNPTLTQFPPTHFMRQVNQAVPAGTEGTSVMPLTGHVLSDPHPETGEGLMGYYLRTSAQTGGDPGAQGGIIMYQQGFAGRPWQEIVDSYGVRNPAVPHPAGWVDPYAPGQTQQPAPSGNGGTGPIAWGSLREVDKAYAIATFKRRPGTNVPVAIAAAFNGAGDWSNWAENNEPAIAAIDLAAYAGPLKGEL